jgi:hypothetical protein
MSVDEPDVGPPDLLRRQELRAPKNVHVDAAARQRDG